MSPIKTDVCVIGGGSGGLSVAAGAVQMGANVVLCEGHKMGGDCLNYGCVPSKSIIEASRANYIANHSQAFGIKADKISVDFEQVNKHIHSVIDTIYEHDSVERFQNLGVQVVQEYAQLIDSNTVKAGPHTIEAKYIVLATGSRSRILPLKGLEDIDYYTNETVFDLKEKPDHLAVIGGGPIGSELAQAYSSLGCKVSIIEAADTILGIADRDCIEILKNQFKSQDIDVYEQANITEFIPEGSGTKIKFDINEQLTSITASHVLMATGRSPNIEKLALQKAGIEHTNKGVTVDARLRTNKKNVFAIGDLASPYQFTHTAGYHAGIVIRNILFKLPAKVNYNSFPWVVYCQPELAHVGMNLEQAKKQGAKILESPYKDNDRAQAGLHTNGLLKVAIDKKARVLGATIVGENAGELITQWTIVIANQLKLKDIAGIIVPYPTLSEMNKSIAGSYYTPTLYSDRVKKIVRFLLKLF